MELPLDLIDEFLKSHRGYLTKPKVEFGNYFFSWEKKSYGIYSIEVDRFRLFVRKALPCLAGSMEMLYSAKKKSPANLVIGRGKLSLSERYDKATRFALEVDSFGSTVFYRKEIVTISGRMHGSPMEDDDDDDNNSSSSKYNSKVPDASIDIKDMGNGVSHEVCIEWKLGELLFRR
jgi:hypothetical protein